jgi:hypothetical protein
MASIDGIWTVSIQTGKGDQDWRFEFRSAGEEFTGTMTMQPDSVEIENGRIDGDSLTWELTLNPPNRVHVRGSATVSGDGISGVLDMGAYGVRSFAGGRG